VGHVSTEGGPLLLADRETALIWTGAIDGDYKRACALLDTEPDVNDRQAATQMELPEGTVVLWDMPTGTATIWRQDESSLILCRAWLDDEADLARLAGMPPNEPLTFGRLTVHSGWLVIVWATECGEDIAAIPPSDGLSLNLSLESAGITVALPEGDYVCYRDTVEIGAASARRCIVTLSKHR
jgi:hypothetical protein